MAPRAAPRKARENDYSNVGKAGRRTGVTLPEGRRDEFGLEEITGIFSSPQKPSPVQAVAALQYAPEPAIAQSVRKSLRAPSLPRSASPRKTGINGIARRSEGLDLSPTKQAAPAYESNTPPLPPTYPTPIPINGNLLPKFSPEKSPLKDVSSNRSFSRNRSEQKSKGKDKLVFDDPKPYNDVSNKNSRRSNTDSRYSSPDQQYEDNVVGMDDDEEQDAYTAGPDHLIPSVERIDLDAEVQNSVEDSDGDQSPAKAKGARKRKSDEFEESVKARTQQPIATQPNTKKARTVATKRKQKARADSEAYAGSNNGAESNIEAEAPKPESRTVGSNKDPNLPISSRQQKELEEVVERIKARPGKSKSLYILKRETPTDDSATYTRSGRVSVKPLAYWRNERCIYGDSSDIPEGSRFPLTTIKEIIRTEEVEVQNGRRGKSSTKSKKGKDTIRSNLDSTPEDDRADTDVEANPEPWETESGVYVGSVKQWDPDGQTEDDPLVEMDLAYAPDAIEIREVRNASFRYAKLLSTPFFGSGIVDIPPGGEKRPKNSRKMHMCFYVFEGRVDVDVSGNQFSVGKGGFWQVPRGNSYSIANNLKKPARIFFSQGCVTTMDESTAGDE